MRKYLKPLLAIVIYFGMQIVASIPLVFILSSAGHMVTEEELANHPTLLGITMIISVIIAVAIISALKLIRWKSLFSYQEMQDKSILMPLLASLAGIFAITIFLEQIDVEQPDLSSLMYNFWGLLYVCLLGPICEEICCREAMQGGLLRRGVTPWVAILLTSFFFGAMHGNLGQFLAAGMMGVILGILYYKTGNILLPCLLHIFNNSLSSIMSVTMGEDATMTSLLGGQTTAIAVGTVLAALCAWYFVRYWRATPAIDFCAEQKTEA